MDGNQQPTPPEQPGSWQFVPDEQAAAPYTGTVPTRSVAVPPTGAEGSITWTASEFIAHHKTPGWFAMLGGGALLAAIIAWFITKDVVTAASFIGGALLFGAFAARQPRELTYRIDQSGLHIGPKFYHFGEFRSFAVMAEGAFSSIVFTPLKRFSPLLTVYYDPKDEAKITDVLNLYVPYQPRKADPIDRLMWRIRF